jgi:DNA-binding CsgD family transcriptional regulator
VEPLSPREHEVALLVARGFSNKEVARELGITDGTVKLHVHKIFQKLGVRTRYGIAMAYLFGVRPTYSDARDRKRPIIRLTSAEGQPARFAGTFTPKISSPRRSIRPRPRVVPSTD